MILFSFLLDFEDDNIIANMYFLFRWTDFIQGAVILYMMLINLYMNIWNIMKISQFAVLLNIALLGICL